VARRLAVERGYTLIEVLIAASLMVVVLTAALTSFDGLLSGQSTASTRFDAQDRARTALDRLARDLRNVSGASTGAKEIDVSSAYELIFRTTNPAGPPNGQNSTNLERVRYCVDTTNPANETLRVMTQTWGISSVPDPPSTPCDSTPYSATTCPTSWCSNSVYADHVTNEANGQTRPLFSYTSVNGTVNVVHTDIFINGVATTTSATNSRASETELSSGVFLRNQDVAPSAAFTVTPGVGYLTLDGSASVDPNGQPLTYVWYDGATKLGSSNSNSPGATSGIVFTYNKDACASSPCTSNPIQLGQPLLHNTAYTVSLKVYDPAGLEGDAPAQTWTVK
jgi:prepilin-type N-terminal cleavage/methylation domain-containing protein